jgi:C-terminal processing protease CtpA/Prc
VRVRLDLSALPSRASLLDLATAAGVPLPPHEQHRELNYWLTLDEPSSTLYLQYNRCQNAGESLAAVADRAFRTLDQDGADRLVVDVRHNGGGESSVDDHLIDGIRSRSAWRTRGRLYCLIGGETFSSGMWTADDLRKLGAVLVGSPTGGKPNSYGNVSTLQLPNSLLQVGYSTRHYQLLTGSDPPWIAPELAVEPTIADLRAGRDALLEAVLADRR